VSGSAWSASADRAQQARCRVHHHKPVVGGSDEGIWRRLKVVPFKVVIAWRRRQAAPGRLTPVEYEMINTAQDTLAA